MSRLVVVSNRLPLGRPSRTGGELEIPAGGLVSALLAALERAGGSLWFGWDGRASEDRIPSRHVVRGVELIGAALTRREVNGYYLGFCNEALWPLLHCFQDRLRLDGERLAMYRSVQSRFADALLDLLRDDDMIWIHDYHLFLLGRELRRRGFQGRIGFFLHTPFPPHDLWSLLPEGGDFLDAILAHDLVGFHTRTYCENFAVCCQRELSASWDEDRIHHEGRSIRLDAYPVGIEVDDFAPGPRSVKRPKRTTKLSSMVDSRVVVLGVDRLDYTKGLVERFRAFEQFLRAHGDWRRRISFVQIASPSRASLAWYAREKREIELLVGRINGELGDADWVPIRYLYRTYPRDVLTRFYRGADVALVTPLRDGMNLVAKEFVASQNPNNPGVLILSRFAGAAEAMPEAIQVNPYVIEEIVQALAAALGMPLEERRVRHQALMAGVRRDSASRWAERFIEDLKKPALGVRSAIARG